MLARYMVLGVIFTVIYTTCPFNNDEPGTITVNSLSEVEKKLSAYPYGNSIINPLEVRVNMDIGDLSQPGNDYLRLIEIIGNSGLYVKLFLGGAGMGGTTVFTTPPLNNAAKGMDKIIRIQLPGSAASVMAASNEISPFLFYEKLVEVRFDGIGLPEIGDFAFSSCKNLKEINMRSAVKTIGREAFKGCDNLESVSFGPSLETIEDKAFFDCGFLRRIRLTGMPPYLGDSVFMGSTPSGLTFSIEENEWLYRGWKAENALKFNNEGKDVVFKVGN